MGKQALVIVDVQVGAFDGIKIAPIDNAQQLIKNIGELLETGREFGVPIIFIQDCGKKGGAFEKGTDHWSIHPDVSPIEGEVVIQKTQSDAFEGTPLQTLLSDLAVDTVVACGLHSEHCLTKTCLAAMEYQFNVIVVKDGHGSSSSSAESALTKIIRQNELLAARGAAIRSTAELVTSWADGHV